MDNIYKLLRSADVALLKELLGIFGKVFNEPETYQSNVPSDVYLKSLLGKEHFIVVVAQSEGRIVGGLTAYVLEKYEQERKEIYIYDLAVSEDYRRKGIARGLIGKLNDIAGERGAYIIFVQADLEDTPAIRLYSYLGKKEPVYHFDIPVKYEMQDNL